MHDRKVDIPQAEPAAEAAAAEQRTASLNDPRSVAAKMKNKKVSREIIRSIENMAKPLKGRNTILDPAGKLTALPRPQVDG